MSLSAVRVSVRPPWIDISRHERGSCVVRLGGPFAPTWMASLCEGIADHGLSIQTAHAMLGADASWVSELTLVETRGATSAEEVPYLELAQKSLVATPLEIAIDRIHVVSTKDHGGTLRLTLEANDEIGLLGSLLSQLAEAHLYPLEMHIETQRGRAHDQLWLRTLDGQAPTEEVRASVERMLRLAAPR